MVTLPFLYYLKKESLLFKIAKDSIRNDTIAQLLQRRQEYDERENNRALNEFRALHQQPSAQRTKRINSKKKQQYFLFILINRRMGFK